MNFISVFKPKMDQDKFSSSFVLSVSSLPILTFLHSEKREEKEKNVDKIRNFLLFVKESRKRARKRKIGELIIGK
jgi:hypothetical protein